MIWNFRHCYHCCCWTSLRLLDPRLGFAFSTWDESHQVLLSVCLQHFWGASGIALHLLGYRGVWWSGHVPTLPFVRPWVLLVSFFCFRFANFIANSDWCLGRHASGSCVWIVITARLSLPVRGGSFDHCGFGGSDPTTVHARANPSPFSFVLSVCYVKQEVTLGIPGPFPLPFAFRCASKLLVNVFSPSSIPVVRHPH